MEKREEYSIKNRIQRFWRDINQWSVWLLIIGLLISLPVYTIVLRLFDGPGDMWQHVATNLLATYLYHSLILVLGCSILTVLFGVFCAWFVSQYRFPFRKLLDWALILPLAIPSYITAYAYTGIFDNGGSLQVLMRMLGFDIPKVDLMNIYGLVWVLSISLFPYVYISVRIAFIQHSRRLQEAAYLLGATNRSYFFTIALPLARPAIVGGVLLVLMEALNDYGAAYYYGVRTFCTGIFRSWFGLEDPQTAIYLSALLVTIIFGFIFLEKWQRRNMNYAISLTNSQSELNTSLSATRKSLLSFLVFIPAFFGFVLPVLQLLYWALLSFNQVFNPEFFGIVLQSFGIAMIAALTVTTVAFFLIYFARWNNLSSLRVFSKSTTLGYAIPGAVVAIGIIVPTLAVDKFLVAFFKTHFDHSIGLIINGSIIALIYAYLVRYLAVAYNPLEAASLKIGQNLSESSRILGVNTFRTLFKIEFPLLKTSLLSAFILVFIDILKELPLTLILKPYKVQTLAVKAYEYASDERVIEAALPALLIVFTGGFFILYLKKMISEQ